jgi:hypothetical protein
MEFIVWVETRLAGKTLGVEAVVSTLTLWHSVPLLMALYLH